MFRSGDVVMIRKEYQDAGDSAHFCKVLEDQDGERVLIQHLIGLPINPTERIQAYMLEMIRDARTQHEMNKHQ